MAWEAAMGQTAEPSDLQPGLLEQFTHSANSVMGVDGQQRIILWNHAAEELLGYAAAEVLGQYCYNLM
ncbi:MAG: PAS domain-containing protein, partial [Acidobacteria bacterium]|nr:PAS domain-containing protein [Acidobacteriota bacterium]